MAERPCRKGWRSLVADRSPSAAAGDSRARWDVAKARYEEGRAAEVEATNRGRLVALALRGRGWPYSRISALLGISTPRVAQLSLSSERSDVQQVRDLRRAGHSLNETAALLGLTPSRVSVLDIDPTDEAPLALSGGPRRAWDAAQAMADAARSAQARASDECLAVVVELREAGYSYRGAANVLGVSTSRVYQIATGTTPDKWVRAPSKGPAPASPTTGRRPGRPWPTRE
jgi:predicted transcriptional regulator